MNDQQTTAAMASMEWGALTDHNGFIQIGRIMAVAGCRPRLAVGKPNYDTATLPCLHRQSGGGAERELNMIECASEVSLRTGRKSGFSAKEFADIAGGDKVAMSKLIRMIT
jgi:hypothetical protein